MMIGPRPEAVAEAESKIKTADGLVAFSKAHLDFHTIRAPIDGVLDSLHLPPRSNDRDRHSDRRGRRYSADLRDRLAPPRVGEASASGRRRRSGPADLAAAGASHDDDKEVDRGQGRVRRPDRRSPDRQPAGPRPGRQPRRPADRGRDRASDDHRRRTQRACSKSLPLPSSTWAKGRSSAWSATARPSCCTPKSGRRTRAGSKSPGSDLKEGEPVIVEGGYNLPEGTSVKLSGERTEAETSTPDEAGEGRAEEARAPAEAEK